MRVNVISSALWRSDIFEGVNNEILSHGINFLGGIECDITDSDSACPGPIAPSGHHLFYAAVLVLGKPAGTTGSAVCMPKPVRTGVRHARLEPKQPP